VKWPRAKTLLAACSAAQCLIPECASAADGSLLLEPTSGWAIDYGETSCALRRAFAADGTSAELEILQQAPGAYFRVTVTSGALRLSETSASVRFEPDDRPQIPAYLVPGESVDRRSLAFTDSLQQNVLGSAQPAIGWWDETRDQREKSITSLSIEDGFDRDITLATGEMHEPMVALRTCMRDLYGSWGVDLEAHVSLSEELRPQNAAQVIRQVRHLVPAAFFRSDSNVPAVVRTVVGPDGRVTRCHVDFGEWPESLSAEICDVVTREARFSPARDGTRRRITSYQAILIDR
jgi:hypothetical protein